MADPSSARTRQREATKQRIADAARGRFAALGYDRTTIRAVAADAGVDPGLVMHYFASKRALFAAVAAIPAGDADAPAHDAVQDAVLASLGAKLGGLPDSVLANLRSLLTYPEATAHVRRTLDVQVEDLAARLPGREARERAALLLAINLGVTIGRELLRLEPLRAADPDDLLATLRPAIDALCAEPAEQRAPTR